MCTCACVGVHVHVYVCMCRCTCACVGVCVHSVYTFMCVDDMKGAWIQHVDLLPSFRRVQGGSCRLPRVM